MASINILNDPPNQIVSLEQNLAWSSISLSDITDAKVTLLGFLNDGTTFKRVTKAVIYETIRDYFDQPLLSVRAFLPFKVDSTTVARLPWMHIDETQSGIILPNGYKRQP